MKIRTKLWLTGTAIVVFAIVLPATFILTGESTLQQVKKDSFVDGFSRGVFDITLLLSEYIREPTERGEKQWKDKYIELASLFDVPVNWSKEEELLLDGVRDEYDDLGPLLGELAKATPAPDAPPEATAAAEIFSNRLAGQISVRSQSLVTNTSALKNESKKVLITSIESSRPVVAFLSFLLLLTGIGLFVFFQRSIAWPLGSLTLAVNRLKEGKFGDLEVGTISKRPDEFGVLTIAFRSMATELQKSYENLERKVKERTQDLEITINKTDAQNKELEESKSAMLNVLEDSEQEKEKYHKQVIETRKFQQAVNFATDGVIMTSPDQKILYCNLACEKIGGYTLNEVLGKDVFKLFINPKTPKEVLGRMQNSIISGKTFTTDDMIIKRKNGLDVQVQLAVYPILENNQVKFFVGILHDITHLKEVDRMKSEFLAMASHELRTPLTAIDGLISMILDGEYGGVPEDLRQPLKDVNASSERLIHLVNDLLNLSRIQAGRLKYGIVEFAINDISKSIVGVMQPIAEKKNLLLEIKDFENAKVQADLDKAEQILINLIGNSLKFTDKGSVTISAIIVDEKLDIAVSDTGVGIDEEDKDRLFGKFEKIERSEARPPGTGLGLYLSRLMARKMGGDIWLQKSEPGVGTTFVFSIPLADTETARIAKANIEKEARLHPDQKTD